MKKVDDYLEKKFEEIDSDSFKDLVYDVDDLKELLKDFGYEMCELQKQECYSAYRLETNLSNTNKAILNCKNVCDE